MFYCESPESLPVKMFASRFMFVINGFTSSHNLPLISIQYNDKHISRCVSMKYFVVKLARNDLMFINVLRILRLIQCNIMLQFIVPQHNMYEDALKNWIPKNLLGFGKPKSQFFSNLIKFMIKFYRFTYPPLLHLTSTLIPSINSRIYPA